MNFDPHTTNLPIFDVIGEVKQHLQKENTLIVHAPPGAGKSTVIPNLFRNPSLLKKMLK